MAIAAVRAAAVPDVDEIVRIQADTWAAAYAELVPSASIEQLRGPDARRAWLGAVGAGEGRHVLVASEGEWTVGFCAAAVAGPTDEDPAPTGPSNRGPNDDGPNDDGPNDDGPNDDGPNDDGPNDDGPNDDGPNDDGPNDDGPNDDGPNDDGPNDDGPNDDGPNDDGPNDDGPNDDGPNDDGPNDDGPNDDGPSDGGPNDRGPNDRGPSDDWPSDGGPDPAGPTPGEPTLHNLMIDSSTPVDTTSEGGPDGPSLGPAAWGEIGVLLVEPRWGRRGHGGRLLAAAAEALRAGGALYGLAWIPESDEASRRFYAKAGWEPDGSIRGLDTGGGTLREVRVTGSLDLTLQE